MIGHLAAVDAIRIFLWVFFWVMFVEGLLISLFLLTFVGLGAVWMALCALGRLMTDIWEELKGSL